MTELDKLIDAVEGGTFIIDVIPHEVTAYKAFNGSLDAAKALHDALLPGWWVQHIGHNLAGWGVRLETRGVSLPESCLLPRSENPARAWLIAILKAYKSQQEANQ